MKKSVIFAAMACMVHSVVAAGLGEGSEIALGGEYQGHLQDVWWDGGTNLWWAHTHQILRTDLVGRVLASVDVEGHNAGVEVRDGRLFVAVCPMQEKTGGKTTSECHPQINVHDAVTLRLLERHILDHVTDRIGSLAILPDHSFVVGCLRPQDIGRTQIRLHHLANDYSLLQSAVIDNAAVPLGIETIKYHDGELYLGMNGVNGLTIVLDTAEFREKRRHSFKGTMGLVFNGRFAWIGMSDWDAQTGVWRSRLVRYPIPDGFLSAPSP